MSSLVEFAENELRLAGFFDSDSDYSEMLGEAVLNLIKAFAEEGHSGTSAEQTLQLFECLARYHPLSPLTGFDDEWEECWENHWQNKRAPNIFKDESGLSYHIDYFVFCDPDGGYFTNSKSRRKIQFPYTEAHKHQYIQVDFDGNILLENGRNL